MKPMLSTEYLYGVSPAFFKDAIYQDALQLKVECGRHLLKEIAVNKDDPERYIAVEKAIAWNIKLQEEISEYVK